MAKRKRSTIRLRGPVAMAFISSLEGALNASTEQRTPPAEQPPNRILTADIILTLTSNQARTLLRVLDDAPMPTFERGSEADDLRQVVAAQCDKQGLQE